MNNADTNKAVDTRAQVKISDTHGWAAGRTGIALGYRATYDNVKVGFVDVDGNYTGEYTMVPRTAVELVPVEVVEPVTGGVAVIISQLAELNREVSSGRRERRIVNDVHGVAWYEGWDGIYRNGYGGAVPFALVQLA